MGTLILKIVSKIQMPKIPGSIPGTTIIHGIRTIVAPLAAEAEVVVVEVNRKRLQRENTLLFRENTSALPQLFVSVKKTEEKPTKCNLWILICINSALLLYLE